jgi:alanine dehydrogenase
MKIGIPKEIKDNEYRVAITVGSTEMLVRAGHQVLIQKSAGEGSGITDQEYQKVGAQILDTAADVWSQTQMIMKVKEPQESEFKYLREGLILLTYLHLAAEPELTRKLVDKKVTAIGYETIQLPSGILPCLTPMSEVAGRMSIQIGARYLEKENEGRGKLLGGVPGVRPADVVVVGGGIVGYNAAKIALGMGAHVTVIDMNAERLRYVEDIIHGRITTLISNYRNIAEAVRDADLVIGAVLIPGAKAPRLVTREMVETMKKGSVIVDVSIDQGGCIETAHPTTHSDPIYTVNGVIHYCVTNIPGAVPMTSTYALSNATLPYAMKIANMGIERALEADTALALGLNTCEGRVTYKPVADAHGMAYVPYNP